MKTNVPFEPTLQTRTFILVLIGATAIWTMSATARGQIFVANYSNDTIGKYTTAGTTINASLVPTAGLFNPAGIAVSGTNVFVANYASNTVSEYTTAGAQVSDSLVPTAALNGPRGIAVSGGHLFVANYLSDTISEYTTAGVLVNASLVPTAGLFGPSGIAVSGDKLFIANYQSDTIGEYTTSGATINASLVPTAPLFGPAGIAVSGGDLFVANFQSDTISEFTTAGVLVNASLVATAGLFNPSGVAVSGDKLFVANYQSDSIGEYTTAGATINASLVPIAGLFGPAGIAVAATAWTGASSTNWADTGNWTDVVPGGATGKTNTDTALFNQSAPRSPLTIDAGRNVQNVTFDTASLNSLIIGTTGGNALLLTAGGTIQTTSTVASAQTINAPLVLEGDYTLTSGADSNSATLSFGGKITPAATSGVTTLTLDGANSGVNTIGGVLADHGAGLLAVAKSGTGLWILSGANAYSGGTTVTGGTLKLDVASGTPTIAAGTTVTVAAGATLELAGSISALGAATGNRAHLVNNSTAPGIVVSGVGQIVGAIDGTGTTQVSAGGQLMANHIIQSALNIGGAAGSPALLTIDASDASGNPLIPSPLSLLGDSELSTLSEPFGTSGVGSAELESSAGAAADSMANSFGNLGSAGSPASVPEPSTLWLLLIVLLCAINQPLAAWQHARQRGI